MLPMRRRVFRIATLGGGTGTFTVLSGLRAYPDVDLTAIVSSADDGGSTGRLRDAYGMLPPGDARQALVALSEERELMRRLFMHRFGRGDIAGHNFGNLFITALRNVLGSDTRAIAEASRILRVRGRVLSVSSRASELVAHLSNGETLVGEHTIDTPTRRAPIEKVELKEPRPLAPAARAALLRADLVILGPGDLYTSTIAALLPSGMRHALARSRARLVYVVNLFTKRGQTDGYTAQQHAQEVEKYTGRALDAILLHRGSFPPSVLARYVREGEKRVEDDCGHDPRAVRRTLASFKMVKAVPEDPVPRSLVRHDPQKLARALYALL